MGIVERVGSRLGAVPAGGHYDTGNEAIGMAPPPQAPGLIERMGQPVMPQSPEHHVPVGEDRTRVGFTPLELRPNAGTAHSAPKLDLDFEYLRSRNLIVPSGERTQIAEGFRRVKRHVLANVLKVRPGLPVNRMMITSALPGEGKTFCSINLAISMAMEMNRSVILVDADTIKPNILMSLGIEKAPRGLMDVLADPSLDVNEFICTTNIDNLRILPAGSTHPRSTELLASETMKRLVYDLAGGYDDRMVIFDSPPLLVASEAVALAPHMSQVLMVTAAGQTTEAAVKEALRRLEGINGPIGMILNKRTGWNTSYAYYGYGYGYGYGRGNGA